MNEEDWKNLINGIDPSPLEGSDAPAMESFPKESIKDGESPVTLQKIITEVYVYTSSNLDDLWFGSQTLQDVQVIGQMRLSEALKLIQAAKNKRRRRK